MKNFFLSLDFLSPSPQIYYLTKTRFANSFGTIISIIIFLTILSFFIYFLSFFLSYTNPSIYSYVEPTYSSSLDLTNKKIRFKIVDQYNNEVNPRIVQVVPFLTNITNDNIETQHLLNTSKCNINDLVSLNKNYLTNTNDASNKFFISNFTCISNNINSYSKLSFNNSFQSYITAYVAKCINNTKNNRFCLPADDIDIYLIKNKIFLLMYIENIWVNHTKKEPMIKSYSVRKIEVDMSFYYKYYHSFQEVKYKSDNGLIFEKINEYKDFVFDSNNNYNSNGQNNIGNYRLGLISTVNMVYPNTLMEAVFSLNREFSLTYVRSYPKLQSVFASGGGFCYIIFIIGKLIVYMFANGKMFVEIITIRNKLQAKKTLTKINNNNNKQGDNDANVKQTPLGNESGNANQSDSMINLNNKNNNVISNINKNVNNVVSPSLISYTKYSKEKELSKIKEKLNQKKQKLQLTKKKDISYCDSFIYCFICVKPNSIKYGFMRYCELAVKTKFSSDDLIYKLNDLDLLITSHVNENNQQVAITTKTTHVDDITDEKTSLIEIKEISEYSFENEKQNSIRHISSSTEQKD